MKIFIPQMSWIGNWDKYLKVSFAGEKVEVVSNTNEFKLNSVIHTLRLQQINKIRTSELKYSLNKYNRILLEQCLQAKPDVFIVMNENKLFPTTIEAIKNKCKCHMVCILADNPWDSVRYIADFPHSLKYFDIIFNAEPAWDINIIKVAPNARIYHHHGGVDTNTFYPLEENSFNEEDRKLFTCEVSFTGSSYGNKAEGAYRSDILSYLTDFDLKIWGDDNWPYRFKYLPELKKRFKGSRLPYIDLLRLYTLSKINLNLPAPQILTGFQPRVFEIAAVKGFQIADNRPLLRNYFNEEELVTFDTVGELRDKVDYYINHESERTAMAGRLYKKVIENYTWKHWANRIIDIIRKPDDFEQVSY